MTGAVVSTTVVDLPKGDSLCELLCDTCVGVTGNEYVVDGAVFFLIESGSIDDDEPARGVASRFLLLWYGKRCLRLRGIPEGRSAGRSWSEAASEDSLSGGPGGGSSSSVDIFADSRDELRA